MMQLSIKYLSVSVVLFTSTSCRMLNCSRRLNSDFKRVSLEARIIHDYLSQRNLDVKKTVCVVPYSPEIWMFKFMSFSASDYVLRNNTLFDKRDISGEIGKSPYLAPFYIPILVDDFIAVNFFPCENYNSWFADEFQGVSQPFVNFQERFVPEQYMFRNRDDGELIDEFMLISRVGVSKNEDFAIFVVFIFSPRSPLNPVYSVFMSYDVRTKKWILKGEIRTSFWENRNL